MVQKIGWLWYAPVFFNDGGLTARSGLIWPSQNP